MFAKKNILGVGITDATKREILEFIIKGLEKKGEKYFIVTPNPEFLVLAHDKPEYKKVLNRAKIASADGIGVVWAGKILGRRVKERITGVDLLESVCKGVAKKPITVGFLGGGSKIAETAAECLRQKYPGLKVVFAGKEWPKGYFGRLPQDSRGPVAPSSRPTSSVASSLRSLDGTPSSRATPRHNNLTMEQFNNGTIDILFVAFGAPKQEMWMSENLKRLPVRVMMGVGGSLDYISGRVGRAPSWMQNIGLEWLYRLIRQPWRIKRQLSLFKFIFLVLKEKVNEKMSA